MFEDNLRKLRERLQQEQEQVSIFTLEMRGWGSTRVLHQQCKEAAQMCAAGAASRDV